MSDRLLHGQCEHLTRSPTGALCEVCGNAAHYVLSDEALDFCADCAVALLSEQASRLHVLLKGLVEAEKDPCSFDHHGQCQMHGWFGEPGECYTRQAREAVGLDA
jgi:hypothetical protein